uniref:Uncharacterized protein n=1 Tax=Anopheles albimanus TaxID=7167 RepID=A0A182FY94_ANOAL
MYLLAMQGYYGEMKAIIIVICIFICGNKTIADILTFGTYSSSLKMCYYERILSWSFSPRIIEVKRDNTKVLAYLSIETPDSKTTAEISGVLEQTDITILIRDKLTRRFRKNAEVYGYCKKLSEVIGAAQLQFASASIDVPIANKPSSVKPSTSSLTSHIAAVTDASSSSIPLIRPSNVVAPIVPVIG